MLRKIQNSLLVACIGLISADRIDLSFGHAPFLLTPFLVLAPLVIGIAVARSAFNGRMHLVISPEVRRQFPYLIALGFFLLFAFISIPFGLDPLRGAVMFAELVLASVLGYCISVLIATAPDRSKLIVRSVTFALVMYTLFCIGECIAWGHGLILDLDHPSASWAYWSFAPEPLGLFAPRLSGTVYDPNRASFVLVMYLALLDRFAEKSWYTRMLGVLIGVFSIITISRSGVLCWLVYYMFTSRFWKGLVSKRVWVFILAFCFVSILAYVKYQEQIESLAAGSQFAVAMTTKMSMGQGSSGESHVLLIERGFKVWLTSPQTILTGIGLGAGHKVLTDLLGDSKYINFHCLYITILTEMGLPAFITLLFILCYPVIGRRGTLPCIAAIVIFNISYQSHSDPIFWAMLAVLWSCERRSVPQMFAGPSLAPALAH